MDWPCVPRQCPPLPASVSLMVKWGETYFIGGRINRNGENRRGGTWGQGPLSLQSLPGDIHLGGAEKSINWLEKRGVIQEDCLEDPNCWSCPLCRNPPA